MRERLGFLILCALRIWICTRGVPTVSSGRVRTVTRENWEHSCEIKVTRDQMTGGRFCCRARDVGRESASLRRVYK